MKKFLLLIAAVSLLSACGSKTPEYYKEHPAEMKAKAEACSRMSEAEKMADRECAAISKADSDRFFGDHMEKPGAPRGRGTKQY